MVQRLPAARGAGCPSSTKALNGYRNRSARRRVLAGKSRKWMATASAWRKGAGDLGSTGLIGGDLLALWMASNPA
jgi:hypothetical protein